MSWIREFGAYLPSRRVSNEEIGTLAGADAQWILEVSGIEERRFAAEGEEVADLAVAAGQDCLSRAGAGQSEIGMVMVASGSAGRRFPGPAATVAHRLSLTGAFALDVPIASAGSLFGMALAARLAPSSGGILVIAAEKMSGVALQHPVEKNTAVLFGDGAGACLVSRTAGRARIVDSALYSDGAFAEDLRLEFDGPVRMNGRAVIVQASRKIPRAISELLSRNAWTPGEIEIFLLHQANQNLITRVADAVGVAPGKFYSNIHQYGNTSSASMLIAAKEWWEGANPRAGARVVFAGFGAGFHWGALLAEVV
ncbi:MAG: 3-oxoacyl-ACP synthase III family protein [Bryobacteraceae bacterium]